MLTRRDFMKSAGCTAAGLAVGRLAHAEDGMATDMQSRPNILFILADDLGWNDVGYHGSEIGTPHIDRLAEEGVRFECAYVTPSCSPTRTSLLTGCFPSRYGVVGPTNERVLEPGATTLASALGEAGYDTGLCGKWHLGSHPDWGPQHAGFDYSYGSLAGGVHPYTHRYKVGPYSRTWHRNGEFIHEEGHVTELIGREAVGFIERAAKSEAPFFLYVPFTAVHIPIAEPERWTALYEGEIANEARRRYAASATHMDHWIGEMLKALEQAGLREDTLVVFASDNGAQKSWDTVGEYPDEDPSMASPVLGSNEPWRGWKGDIYEGGIRVPMLVNQPGVVAPGVVSDPVHIADWMPTLCGLAGHGPERDRPCDGRDIWPLVQGRSPQPRTLYWRTTNAQAVRQGPWKLIQSKGDGRRVLYNLAEDPGEERDLAREMPERVAELEALLERHQERDAKEMVPFMREPEA